MTGDPSVPTTRPLVLVYRCRIPHGADDAHVHAGLDRLPRRLHGEITRYKRLPDRLARLAARLLVRRALQAAGFQAASTLEGWHKDERGRPHLRSVEADISISHSADWVVAAVGFAVRVGVDVEAFTPVALDTFAPYLSAAERQRISTAADPSAEIIRCWTRREAILKGDGRGLIVAEQVLRNIAQLEAGQGGPWHVACLELDVAYLCVATDQPAARIVHRQRTFDDLL